MYLLGIDVGSSSIKATLLDGANGAVLATKSSPEIELEIIAKKAGWAEQHPHVWWDNVKLAVAHVVQRAEVDPGDIGAIGISYQMHGLVVVDKYQKVLMPSIIWCDSRAVDTGNRAFKELGPEVCLTRLLNSPGNFTASKLKWLCDNEPDVFARIHKAMLPGDYIAMKMTGDIRTTPSGLSEMILWDYQREDVADILLDYYGIPRAMLPECVQTFSVQGELSRRAADELGLLPGVKVSYRAGDQPNNALSLNVLNPGEIAATAGTSGVVYGVADTPCHDEKSRVNTFLHVNHTKKDPRLGVLMCINGTGILNRWLKNNVMKIGQASMTYDQMNELAFKAPVGADGLVILPYGNGAERTLENRDLGCSFNNLKFTIHTRRHYLRAAQEGIVFALNYGLSIAKGMGVHARKVRAGNTNMFLSELFSEAFASVTEATVELYNTDGSQGAARGAGIGVGYYSSPVEAFAGLRTIHTIEPRSELVKAYREAYDRWKEVLGHRMKEIEES